MFSSTKIIELGSCAFRQPNADSHCKYLHGYRLTAKFWFEAKHLDNNNWVVDFGGLKELKRMLQAQFDHTTCISKDDSHVSKFQELDRAGVLDLRLMDGVGIEKFAEWCHAAADNFVSILTNMRCSCVKVEMFEHENNSAIYTKPSNDMDLWSGFPLLEKQIIPTDNTLTPPVEPTEAPVSKPVSKPVANKQPSQDDMNPLYGKKQTNKWIDTESKNVWGW